TPMAPRRSSATAIHPPLPPVVHAELRASLTLARAEMPPAVGSALEHSASLANPKFFEMQRLRKSTWGIPRFVLGYDRTLDGELVLPRALRHDVADIVQRAGSRLDLHDERDSGAEIEPSFQGELRPSQRRSEEHTSELQSRFDLVCRLLLEKKNRTRLTRLCRTRAVW